MGTPALTVGTERTLQRLGWLEGTGEAQEVQLKGCAWCMEGRWGLGVGVGCERGGGGGRGHCLEEVGLQPPSPMHP